MTHSPLPPHDVLYCQISHGHSWKQGYVEGRLRFSVSEITVKSKGIFSSRLRNPIKSSVYKIPHIHMLIFPFIQPISNYILSNFCNLYTFIIPITEISPKSSLFRIPFNCDTVCVLSHFSSVWLFATLWTVAGQAPQSIRFSRQEYWSGLPCSPPWDLPDPGMEPVSLISPALTNRFFTTSASWEALNPQ